MKGGLVCHNYSRYASRAWVSFCRCPWAPRSLACGWLLGFVSGMSASEWSVFRPDKLTALAQTCAIPPCMKERAYRILILLSANMLSCMVMVMQTDGMNCSSLSQLPLELSSSAALAPLGG